VADVIQLSAIVLKDAAACLELGRYKCNKIHGRLGPKINPKLQTIGVFDSNLNADQAWGLHWQKVMHNYMDHEGRNVR
jgi:hypothetical protein